MEAIRLFIENHPKAGLVIMIVCVLFVTTIIKALARPLIKKIKSPAAQAWAKATFAIIAVGVSIAVQYAVTKIMGVAFKLDFGLYLGALSSGAYDIYEAIIEKPIKYISECRKKGKKVKAEDVIDVIDDGLNKALKNKKDKALDITPEPENAEQKDTFNLDEEMKKFLKD